MRKNVANNVKLFTKLLVFMTNILRTEINKSINAPILNQMINKQVILKYNRSKN